MSLSEYGLNFGISYQIVDDLLDLLSTDSKLGKPTGNGLREGNLSLPLIHILQNGNEDFKEQLIWTLSRGAISDTKLREVADIVNNSGARSYTQSIAENYAGKAKNALAIIEDSPAKQCLLSFADFVVNRRLAEISHQSTEISMS
jgi:octaprenyl-diphosphate synthase